MKSLIKFLAVSLLVCNIVACTSPSVDTTRIGNRFGEIFVEEVTAAVDQVIPDKVVASVNAGGSINGKKVTILGLELGGSFSITK